jgi:O-antigen/teichoic acid export membrane protein
MLLYSLPLGFATMLGTLTMQLHALIVATLCSPDEFSIYINGAIELPIISIVTGSITSILLSDMSAQCANGNLSEALGLFRAASIQSACILLPAMCFFFVMAEPFIVVMYSKEYIKSLNPFLMYLGIMPGRIVVYGAAMMALGMTREVMWRSLIDLIINAVLCWLFVRIFGYVGAALGLVCTIYFWTIPFNLYKLSKGFNVGLSEILPWTSLGKIFIVSLASGILLFCTRQFYVSSNTIYELMVSFLAFICFVSFLLHKTRCISIFSVLKRLNLCAVNCAKNE